MKNFKLKTIKTKACPNKSIKFSTNLILVQPKVSINLSRSCSHADQRHEITKTQGQPTISKQQIKIQTKLSVQQTYSGLWKDSHLLEEQVLILKTIKFPLRNLKSFANYFVKIDRRNLVYDLLKN